MQQQVSQSKARNPRVRSGERERGNKSRRVSAKGRLNVSEEEIFCVSLLPFVLLSRAAAAAAAVLLL